MTYIEKCGPIKCGAENAEKLEFLVEVECITVTLEYNLALSRKPDYMNA